VDVNLVELRCQKFALQPTEPSLGSLVNQKESEMRIGQVAFEFLF